jgi:hypothetical protein
VEDTDCRCPSRITCASGAANFFKAASACSARLSWITPKVAFKITIARIAAASSISPNSADMTAATISNITTKLLNWSNNICQKVIPGASVSWFGP